MCVRVRDRERDRVRVRVRERERERERAKSDTNWSGPDIKFIVLCFLFFQDTVFCQMRRALDLIHFIVKESVTESTTKFGFDFTDLTCGIEDDSEMVRIFYGMDCTTTAFLLAQSALDGCCFRSRMMTCACPGSRKRTPCRNDLQWRIWHYHGSFIDSYSSLHWCLF